MQVKGLIHVQGQKSFNNGSQQCLGSKVKICEIVAVMAIKKFDFRNHSLKEDWVFFIWSCSWRTPLWFNCHYRTWWFTWFTVDELQWVQSHSQSLFPQTGSVNEGHLKRLVHLTNGNLQNLPLCPATRREYFYQSSTTFWTTAQLLVLVVDVT